MPERRKVFCLGFHKTGTTSLYDALRQLGYRVCATVGHDWTIDALRERGAAFCIETMKDFDAAEDMPWPLYYRELDQAYPGSKFILTVRDPEDWFRSIDNHFGERAAPLHALVYGDDAMQARHARERWIAAFNAHNAAVKDYFSDRPSDLLVMDLSRNTGWDALCAHLGCKAPEAPFPRRNTAADRRSLLYRLKRRIHLLTGRSLHPEKLS